MADDLRLPLADAAPVDVQATFCSTLVDEWLDLGVRHAVVAPGSRSTPMALALTARAEMNVHVVHDERVAAFTALGLGLAAGEAGRPAPALLLCTSGTAAANFLPAVAEAGLSEVPMIVLTADRPEELRGVGAPQTIDQIELYGSHVRWFHDPGVPEAATAGEWRGLAGTAWTYSMGGPVQLNLPFREPLVGTPQEMPQRVGNDLDTTSTPTSTASAPAGVDTDRGVILVGGMSGVPADAVVALRDATGWPIIADPQSGMRGVSDVVAVDALLRVESVADDLLPGVIVRVGRPSTSKVLAQWTARPGPTLIQVGGPGRIDPSGTVSAVCSIADLIEAVGDGSGGRDWIATWRRLDAVAQETLSAELAAAQGLTEPAVARALVDHLPAGAHVTVSSSMPVRDVEWFGGRTPFVHSNRGANGIDGVMSTALGRALGHESGSGSPSFVLIGDLAFVHDSNALVGVTLRGVDLRIVVVDNDGGGIFSFLPQANLLEHERFEQLFGTPLGTDVLALAAAHGLDTATATTVDELATQIARPGPWVCRVPTNRAENVDVHDALHAAVATAIGEAPRTT